MRAFLFLLLWCVAPAFADADADFLAARDAFAKGDAVKLARLAQSPTLKKSPLRVYLDYYRLRLDLNQSAPAAMAKFLAQPEDTPIIDRLRGDWLKMLGKQQRWDLFDAEYPRLLNADTELTCYALQSQQRDQPQAALIAARALWFSGKALPDSCDPLFAAATADGTISGDDVMRRMQLALEDSNVSLATRLTGLLGGERALPPDGLTRAAADAVAYLQRANLQQASPGERMVALFALHRLAKQSPDVAIAQWNKIADHFPAPEQHYFYSWLAYEAARKQDNRALQWFAAAADAPLNAEQAAWRVRAALRVQDWSAVLAGIARMDAAQQAELTWQYWKSRALTATGNQPEARKLLRALRDEHSFYGQLAREDLAEPVLGNPPPSGFVPRDRDLAALQSLPGIQRALALYRMELTTEGWREWNWAVRNLNDRELLTAAELARRNEIYDRAIVTAERTVKLHDFTLRYLAPYRDAMRAHVRENDLDEAWVYGLMRQESRFIKVAKSRVGAAGLMQIMPATASWVAKKMGLKGFRRDMIYQLDTNLKLGTFYMKTVLSRFDGSPVLASAGYNAGPGRAQRWRADHPLEGAIYAETIPFDETRTYVKNVLSNTMHYAALFGTSSGTLKQRLGIIPGK